MFGLPMSLVDIVPGVIGQIKCAAYLFGVFIHVMHGEDLIAGLHLYEAARPEPAWERERNIISENVEEIRGRTYIQREYNAPCDQKSTKKTLR